MCDDIFEQKNRYLDQVLAERRTYRLFSPVSPSDEEIRRILHAGLAAPFAATSVGTPKDYFRRFFVIRNGSASIRALHPLLMAEVNALAAELDSAMKDDPKLRADALLFSRRLERIKKLGTIPGIGTAPLYLIAAERRGYPPAGLQSLAHCMENMWLKATALGLGFQLISLTSRMADNEAFCAILGIRSGEWDLMGCAVGYPQDELSPSIRPPVEDLIHWLE